MAIVGFVTAVGVSLVVSGVGILAGPRLGLVDRPDGDLKPHDRPISPLGGAGVLVGLHAGLLVAEVFELSLLIATLLVWALGLADDRYGLGPRVRLAGVGVAGVVLVVLSDADLFSFQGGLWVVAVLVVVNAMNLFDGLDGLAGSVAVVAMAGLWWFGMSIGPGGDSTAFLAAMGATIGFVGWNWPPARVFLGDNGAYVLGVTLVWLAMNASVDGGTSLVAVALIGVPLLDLAATVVRRLASGSVLTSGGRDHVYDRLHGIGMGLATIVGVMIAAQAIWIVVLWSVTRFRSETAGVAVAVLLGSAAAGILSRIPRSPGSRREGISSP